jgi:5-methylcytosine-specific restriction endonuclease McrA
MPTRGKTVARGYGKTHRQIRARLLAERPWCECCGRTTDLTLDHIVPIAKGGKATLANYRVLCRSCNSRRQDRDELVPPPRPRPRFSRSELKGL